MSGNRDWQADFGGVLRRQRMAAGLTQAELAERARLSVRAIRDLERGATARPYRHSVDKLATALGLAGADLAEFTRVARRAPGGGARAAAPAGPRQLPGAAADFTGRTAELKTLAGVLAAAGDTAGTVVVSAIGGTAGVGKTALAVHWAHQVASRFPDGQLYVNLRGYDPGQPMPPADALAAFLRALGVPGHDIPADTGERAARYRSLLAGRRMLVLLDNAGSAEQVRPLLPACPACLTLVTSRDTLAGLVARDGARRLDLDLLAPADAAGLLTTLIGDRAAADPAATTALATACARLPLALRVAAELATARPATALPALVAELADEQQRLDLLDADGDPYTAVRAVFSWSYQHLDPATARAFRLLSLHPGAGFEVYAAAALTGTTRSHAQRLLDTLARANLIHTTTPGQYSQHDLLRDYAHELTTSQDGADERLAALTRLLDHYLHTTAAAMDTLHPADRHRRPRIPAPGTAVPPVTQPAAAARWLETWLPTLVEVVAYAARHGWPRHATQLAATLSRYLDTGGHRAEAVTVHTCAREAAQQAGDQAGEADALAGLGIIDWTQGSYRAAEGRFRQALTLYRRVGDQTGEARALNNLGSAEGLQGRHREASRHFQQALMLYRAAGDQTGEARALTNLGAAHRHLGRHREALGYLEQALELHRAAGSQSGEAETLTELGSVELQNRRYAGAARNFRQALGLFRETGAPAREAYALNGLGEVFIGTGRPGEAHAQHAAALSLASQAGDKREQGRAHDGLGHACRELGDPGQARQHWAQALALYTELDAPEADQVRARLAG